MNCPSWSKSGLISRGPSGVSGYPLLWCNRAGSVDELFIPRDEGSIEQSSRCSVQGIGAAEQLSESQILR